jgi:hypothetical protein
MAQTIKLKRSATSGAIPTTSNLALGEVAINTYDGKMYIKKDVGGTESIVEIGGVGGNSVSYLEAGMIEYEYTATSNQTTFSGSDNNSATLSYTAESILVFLNGVLQDDGVDYTATNGTSVVFGTALAANDEVRIVAFTNVTTTASLQDPTKLDAITTVNAQAAYSLTLNSSAYTPSSQNALIVSLNGITQEPGDSFTISGSTITFDPALVTGDVVDYIVDMGRAVTIGEYSGDLAVGGNLTVGGESTFSGDITMSGFPESIYELRGDIDGGIRFTAQAGEALSKGDVVYISGAAGDNTIVSKAQANSSSTMPAFGFVVANASNGASCQIVTFGNLYGSGGAPLNTSAFNVGDTLYVSATTAGGFTSTPPTGESNLLQNIGKIIRSASSNGVIKVGGAGRTNAVPNLDDGDIFIGNASNQPVTASLNTKIEDYLDGGTSTPVFSTVNSGNITTTGYIAGPSTFTIDPAAVGDNTGTLVVAGNLQVDGTTTTINSTTMTVDDLNITLASGAANAAAANGAGITVDGASATLTYNSTPDAWSFNKNVGIGETNPDTLLHLKKDTTDGIAQVSFENDARQYNVGINGLLSDAWNIYDATAGATRFVLDSSGNVGIGTTDPDTKLHISGGINTGPATAGSTDAAFIVSNADDAYGIHMNVSGATGAGFISAQRNDGTATTYNLSLNPNGGNVGIGTDSPSALLDVSSSDPSIFLTDKTAGAGYGQIRYNGGAFIFDADAGGATGGSEFLRFNVSGTEAMRIDSSGEVGIGISNPQRTLHINGGASRTDVQLTLDGYGETNADGVQFGIQTAGSYIWNFENTDLYFATNNTRRLTIAPGGNVGIGTASPQFQLHLSGSAPGVVMSETGAVKYYRNRAAASALTWDILNTDYSFNSEVMRIDYSGNVGIGTNAPAQKLHVSGGASASTTVRFGESFDTSVQIGPVTATASGMFQFLNASGTSVWSMGYRDGGSGTDGTFRIRKGATLDTAGPLTSLDATGSLTVNSSGQWGATFTSTAANNGGIIINRAAGYNPNIAFQINGTNKWYLNTSASDDSFNWYNSAGTTPQITISQDGNIGINQSPNAWRSVDKAIEFQYSSINDNSGTLSIGRNHYLNSAGNWIAKDTTTATVYQQAGRAHAFWEAGTTTSGSSISYQKIAQFDQDGLKFGNDTATANALDDYEEGTWTPTITNHGGSTTGQTVAGVYTKVGNICHFQGVLTQGSGSTTGFVSLGGFPFNAAGTFGHISINTASSSMIQMSSARVISGYNAFVIKDYDGDGIPSGVSGAVNICFQGSFQVA